MKTKNLVMAGLFLALGLVMPFLTGQIPSLGNKLLPMHIPVLLCGFVCGGPTGLIVGFILPILRSVLFSMPPMYPMAMSMAFELAVYGFVAGVMYRVLPKKNIYIYIALIISMIAGRIVWGIVSTLIYGLSGVKFTWQLFIAGGFINAIPGIIIQIILIPIIVIAMKRANLIENEPK
ncbi:MAG: ECF transporter S component [Anaerovoracaceae bacterium]